MRVHRLELTAFGPFPDTETIDFDRLNEAGIFLLTGPTGAGKTSILDAICFALYGSVPGDRNNAKSLKSHHAAPDVQPVVELDVTMRGRRFRLRRSPAWTKPSRRARSGSRDHHAKAVAMELVDGEWVARSSRIDEVGHLVSRVLGMNRDQFCQVVLLPQGQFQTFLNSGAKERHEVLEALFETGRFQRIEKWLGERRRLADRAYVEQEARVRELAARIEEANDQPLHSQGLPLADLTLVEIAGAISTAALRVASHLDDARRDDAAARQSAKLAEHALSEAVQISDRQARQREARRVLDELQATAAQTHARATAVQRARAAKEVWPFVELVDESTERRDQARQALHALFTAAAQADITLSGDEIAAVDEAAERVRVQLASAMAMQEVEEEVLQMRHDLSAARERQGDAQRRIERLDRRRATVPEELARVTALRDGARPVAARLQAARDTLQRAQRAALATDEATTLAAEAATLETAVREAQSVALRAKDEWLSCREAYLDGIAAVLAAQLSPGDACPVCGGVDHPSPARPAAGHVSAEAEALASTRFAETDDALAAARAQHVAVEHKLTHARAVSDGLTLQQAAVQLEASRQSVSDAEKASVELVALTQQADRLEHELRQLESEAASAQAALSEAQVPVRSLTADLARDEARLQALLGAATAAERVRALTLQRRACDELAAGLRAVAQAEVAYDRQVVRCGTALADSDFADVDAVRSSRMSTTEIANAESLNRAAADARAAADKALADPTLAAAAQLPEPDLEALAAHVESAHAHHSLQSGAVSRLAERLERLDRLGEAFSIQCAELEPLRQARDLAASVATMCAGTSADNATRTRLSHYVLSQRLRQVVTAANTRLAGISGGRYELQHTMQRGVGDTRGGLGLQVHDTYTGQSRDPATLSGGETFYVSLALALGLADLVRDEIGGVELSTLFVDEGFGGLDADTLDEVMDELDSLRAGGRAVGIVSHVQDLRLRVPMQLHVSPSQRGSHLVGS